jgi:Alpha 1,4-glycosyltransferase conserved region
LIEYCWRVCETVDHSRLLWAQIGPQLMGEAVDAVDVPVRILDPSAFYPIDFWQTWHFIQARQVPDDCYAIHLWHSQWRRSGLDPDARYDPRCIYEQLKRKHGVCSPGGAARGPSWFSVARRRLKLLEVGFRQWKRRGKPMPSMPTCPKPETIHERGEQQRRAG